MVIHEAIKLNGSLNVPLKYNAKEDLGLWINLTALFDFYERMVGEDKYASVLPVDGEVDDVLLRDLDPVHDLLPFQVEGDHLNVK